MKKDAMLEELAVSIRSQREERNLKPKVLADWVGVTVPYLYKIESAAARPTIPVLRAIADTLIPPTDPLSRRQDLRIKLLKMAGYPQAAYQDELRAGIYLKIEEQGGRSRSFAEKFDRLLKADEEAARIIEGLLDRLAPPSPLDELEKLGDA